MSEKEMEGEERVSAERVSAERVSAERVSAERVSAERVSAERVSAERVSAERVSAERVSAAIPLAWGGPARTIPKVNLPNAARPWNWLELDKGEAREIWKMLRGFVAYMNTRYIERYDQRIPPCWGEHGALVEELVTLCWSRYLAFESEEATITLAQVWHSQTMPKFFENMSLWLGPDRLRKCQAGKHEDREDDEWPRDAAWQERNGEIEVLDAGRRRVRPVTAMPKTAMPKTAMPEQGAEAPPSEESSSTPPSESETDGPVLRVVDNSYEKGSEHGRATALAEEGEE